MKLLDGKLYPATSVYDCTPKSNLYGILIPLHTDPDENGRCENCGQLSHSEYMRRKENGQLGCGHNSDGTDEDGVCHFCYPLGEQT